MAAVTEETKLPHYVIFNLGKEAAKDPAFIQKHKYLVEKPEPVLDPVYLHPLRSLFCEQYSITIKDLKKIPNHRRTFIGVVLSLCNPEYIHNHRDTVRSGLAEMLSELVGTQRDWVSQQNADIRDILNPPERLMKAHRNAEMPYHEERRQILALSETLFNQLSENEGFNEKRSEGQLTDMFKQQAG